MRLLARACYNTGRRLNTKAGKAAHKEKDNRAQVDADCIPLKPVWSIRETIESIPDVPIISAEKFQHLHKLSSLDMPARDSPEWAKALRGVQDMARLIEGVRHVDLPPAVPAEKGRLPSDGRIWPANIGIPLDLESELDEPAEPQASLMHLAKFTKDGKYYVAPPRQRYED